MSSLNDPDSASLRDRHNHQAADDNAHFSALFQDLSPRLRLFALKLGASEDEAEEVVSQTFESYLLHQQKGNPRPDNPEAYLVTIARNSFYQLKRAERPTQSIEQDEVQIPSPFIDTTLDALEHTLVGRALKALTPSDREIIWLRLVEEQSTEQVAEKLQAKEGATRTRFHRAQAAFRTNYLVAFTESAKNTVCETTAQDLVRYVDGSLPSRRSKRLRAHLETCERCPRVVAELKDEAATIYRIPIVVAGILTLGGLVEASNAGNKAAAASLIATLIAFTGWVLLLVGLGGLLLGPSVTPLGTTAINGVVVPATTSLDVPAPGHSTDWEMTTTLEEASEELPLYIAISGARQSDSEDQPWLTLKVDGEAVLDHVAATEAIGEVIPVGMIAPGESLTVHGHLDRDEGDSDKSLDLSISFAFTTQPGGSAVPQADSAASSPAVTAPVPSETSRLDRILDQALTHPALLLSVLVGTGILVTTALLARKRHRSR